VSESAGKGSTPVAAFDTRDRWRRWRRLKAGVFVTGCRAADSGLCQELVASMIRPMIRARAALMALVAAAALGSAGCLQTITEALLAPEVVAAQGATSGIQALGSAVSGTGLDQTAADLDRIIAEHPDAATRPELQALSDQLKADSGPPSAVSPQRDGSLAEEPERLAERDRRVTVKPDQVNQASDAIGLGPRSTARRSGEQLGPFPEPTPLTTWEPRPYLLDTTPVRIR
jgi:hypothetical protein